MPLPKNFKGRPRPSAAAFSGIVAVNPIDATLIHWLQSWVQKSWLVDNIIVFVGDSYFLRGAVFAALLWWLWWRFRSNCDRVVATFMSSIVAVAVARTIAHIAPYRTRPLWDAAIQFRPAFDGAGVYDGTGLMNWSSFPSDHAVLFLCLATGIFFVSWRLGIFSGLYAVLVVCFPRVYTGVHYPTDILVGGMLGIAIGYALQCTPLRRAMAQPILEWSDKHPAGFYTLAFLATFEMAELFNGFRMIAKGSLRVLRLALVFPDRAMIVLFLAGLLPLGWAILRIRRPRYSPLVFRLGANQTVSDKPVVKKSA